MWNFFIYIFALFQLYFPRFKKPFFFRRNFLSRKLAPLSIISLRSLRKEIIRCILKRKLLKSVHIKSHPFNILFLLCRTVAVLLLYIIHILLFFYLKQFLINISLKFWYFFLSKTFRLLPKIFPLHAIFPCKKSFFL